MIWLAAAAFADPVEEAAPEATPTFRPPIREIDYPNYVDAAGAQLTWPEVRELSAGTSALGEVRRRRIGRTLVRAMFAGATAVEAWGTWKLATEEKWTAYPLGMQTGFTGLCAILSITSAPHDIQADRALVLGEVNGALRHR